MAIVKRDHPNYSDDETFSTLMNELGILAGRWHKTHNEKYIQRYQIIVRALLEMGCEDELDLDLLLPDEFMPEEWHNRFKVKEDTAP